MLVEQTTEIDDLLGGHEAEMLIDVPPRRFLRITPRLHEPQAKSPPLVVDDVLGRSVDHGRSFS
ncbi:hypothetical protein [Micromonospora echinofusca]|uniref:hypothetical protein n=1 Tax=Micromonospora echinofusca TaxID=47858 RepID=UPI0012FDAFC4|nr:hypothetical protein [Micromonospora echinofusca]